MLVSRHWNSVLYASPSIWRTFRLEKPCAFCPLRDGQWRLERLRQWTVEQQREWLRQWAVEQQWEWLCIKLRQLQRVGPLVQQLEVGPQRGTAHTVDVLPGLLYSAAGLPLSHFSARGLDEAISPDAMQALAGLWQLRDVALGSDRFYLPSTSGWALRQLPRLGALRVSAQQFYADMLTSLASMTQLKELHIDSSAPLPGAQGPTALQRLQCLGLGQKAAGTGLAMLPAAAFPRQIQLCFTAPLLKVRGVHLPACSEVARPGQLPCLTSPISSWMQQLHQICAPFACRSGTCRFGRLVDSQFAQPEQRIWLCISATWTSLLPMPFLKWPVR